MLGGTSRRTLARAVTTGRPFARRGGRAAHRADRADRTDRAGTARALTVAGTGAVLAFTGVRGPGLLLEGSSATGPSCTPVTQPLGPATGFTEFVRTDGQRGSESEGAIAYGGNLPTAMTVGTRLTSAASAPTLVIAGSHGQWFNLQKGSAYVVPPSGVNFNGGGSYLASNPIDFAASFAYLEGLSDDLAASAATGTVAVGTAGGNQVLVLSGTNTDYNVFTISAAQLASQSGIGYDVPAGSQVLVNVTGSAPTVTGQMWIKQGGSWQLVSDTTMENWPGILWNYTGPDTFTVQVGSAWGGTILAPRAFVDVASAGHTIGQIIARKLTSNYETHQRLFPNTTCVPSGSGTGTPTPTPTGSATPTGGPTATVTVTETATATATATETATATATATATETVTETATATATATATETVTETATATATATATETVTSSPSPTATTTPGGPGGTPERSDVTIAKAVSDAAPEGGDQVTYTLTVTNQGTAPATGVVVRDDLPSGVTYVSSSPGCSLAGSVLTCAVGDLAPGESVSLEIVATVNPTAGAGRPVDPQSHHWLTPYKSEQQLDLEPGQTRTVTVDCVDGGIVTDGSVRIDHVDQGTGDTSDVHVLYAGSPTTGTWKAIVRNDATGRAQAKAFVACLPAETGVADSQAGTGNSHTHELLADPDLVTDTRALPAGTSPMTVTCATEGTFPIAPTYALSGGEAWLVGSEPVGGRTWELTFLVGDPTTATVGVRCLHLTTSAVQGHTHDLPYTIETATATVPAGAAVERQLHCPDDAKGMVSGWNAPPGVHVLGNDPRLKTRAFRFEGTSSTDQQVTMWLVCFKDRTTVESIGTASPLLVTNVARVTSTSEDADPGNNQATASMLVSPGSTHVSLPRVALRSGGKLELQVLSSVPGKSRVVVKAGGRKLAKGRLVLDPDDQTPGTVKLTTKGKRLLARKDVVAKVTVDPTRGRTARGQVELTS
ncbi:MAG: choice-of-anchor A family protein [Actinomycetota bacterium]|nr:choice-of-anchor A family protein [Actinomycetota bacterium]